MKIPILPFLAIAIIVFVCLSGCVSNKDTQLQIRHVFDKQITSSQSGFEFVLVWYLPPAELVRGKQNNLYMNTRLRSTSAEASRFSLDNETRLRLEDIAIQRLENELESNRMCPHGYKIDQIKWLERSIGFIGKCQ
ncbi:hypothetical protein Q4567_00580 [Aliiglaciecola sp. 2_MG-2023]|uniref:hypothetical protein n=1 Tax=unclassified Aliiglaciecola TaxID=2593648 RepID=UPI0026E3E298|nr:MULTISPECIES: hypothetical protein [unclassified Aliiglaciecola]MDO6709204.1 hypothetical protein [Aliiglaciecola sp. 2_MG-2023]MDO6750352.1 hypothetical protein [Aliiglaciecola sp. 1_MG-2023]